MSVVLLKRIVMIAVLPAVAVITTGCGQQASDNGSPQVAEASHDDHGGETHEDGDGHDHGGWWCTEHGVPEEDCSMCSTTAAAKFKENGDWCDEHNRAESQCFQCDPTRAAKFAKLYEAKFGEAPPKPTE